MAITQVLPPFTTTPNRNTPSTFSADTDQYHLELTPFVPKLNIWAEQANNLQLEINERSENVFNQAVDGGYSQSYLDNKFLDVSNEFDAVDTAFNTALDTKVNIDGNQTINDIKTFTSSPIVPTPTTATQAANKGYVDISSPTSQIIAIPTSNVPIGYLECDGSILSRTTYSDLFAAIGELYGAGDGSTTFQLPDLRGEFIRGWDNGRGVDSSRIIGSYQADELKSHRHTFTASQAAGSGFYYGGDNGSSSTRYTSYTGGTETRPRNIAMMCCIKY